MDVYSLLLREMPEQEIERKIAEKIESMNGFLTRDAALQIIAKERDMKIHQQLKLSEINEAVNNAIAIVKLERVLPLQQFGNGKRLRKILLSDEGGQRELKLWNEDTKLLNNLHIGDMLEINGIYCKNNELNLGYNGKINVLQPASFANLGVLSESEGKKINVRGYVESIEGIKEYEKGGTKKRMFSFMISDGKNNARTIIWDNAERGIELFIGGEIKIENALIKNNEIHVGFSSRLLVKKKCDGITGKVENAEIKGGKLILEIDGKTYEFEREAALKILGVKIAEDILLETVFELKKEKILGKKINLA